MEMSAAMALSLRPDEREALSRSLDEFVAGFRSEQTPIDVVVVDSPTIHGGIVAQAAGLHADLIVMGTHGRSGFQRLVFGSVTEKVLRTAKQPVMTIGLTSDEPIAPSFGRIVCAVDFSACSIAALGYALSLADGAQAHVTVVNVLDWVALGLDPLVGATDLAGFGAGLERAAREHLHRVVAGFTTRGLEVAETVRSGKPHHEILRVAEEQHAELIVLGIHGKNPVDRMLFGSTAEPVVRRATCPVLTVRADVEATVAAA